MTNPKSPSEIVKGIIARYFDRFDSEEPSKFEMVTFFEVYIGEALTEERRLREEAEYVSMCRRHDINEQSIEIEALIDRAEKAEARVKELELEKDTNDLSDVIHLHKRLPAPELSQDVAYVAFSFGKFEVRIKELEAEIEKLNNAIGFWKKEEDLWEGEQKTLQAKLSKAAEALKRLLEARKGIGFRDMAYEHAEQTLKELES